MAQQTMTPLRGYSQEHSLTIIIPSLRDLEISKKRIAYCVKNMVVMSLRMKRSEVLQAEIKPIPKGWHNKL